VSRHLPEDWPTIYVEAHCETCGKDLFSELFRPAVVERFHTGEISISRFWLQVMKQHVEGHQNGKFPLVGGAP
jgi:hypothetical protein